MKRNTGLAATLAVVLAFFGISYLPKNAGNSPPPTEAKAKVTPPVRVQEKDELVSACKEIRSRLERFVAKSKLPNSCLPDDEKDQKKRKQLLDGNEAPETVKFAVAIVPHPVTTHLQLLFDREIEVIQQAAQDDRYTYETSWLPWEDNPPAYPLLADQMVADAARKIREEQPGVLVFRRGTSGPSGPFPYESGLVVFVVAEQPTRGINDLQFRNALDWITGLHSPSPGEPLRVLGPTFSGSLPSLANELTNGSRAYIRKFGKIEVASGTVSSGASYRWFVEFLKDNVPPVTFQTYQEADDLMIDRFLRYLSQESYKNARVAVLSEDETAFGNPKIKAAKEMPTDAILTYLYYPRDIASLRSAYEQQSIFSAGKQAANPNAPGTTLRGDLNKPENANEHDTVRTYGGQLTPLAQESVLLDIASILFEKKIEFVIIRSTNDLDQIFLAQFLRRAYRSGRVVIDGADLLFHRGAEGSSLRGVMTLSTYPLLTQGQDWTSSTQFPANGSYRVFGQDMAEGLYIAARLLFGIDPNTQVPVHDYAPPAWLRTRDGKVPLENEQPPTWVSVIGHRQFWPVAVLNRDTLKDPNPKSILKPHPNNGDAEQRPPIYFPGEMKFLLVFCLIWAGWHLFCCWRGSLLEAPRCLAYFAPDSGNEHKALILLGSALLALLAILVPACSGLSTGYLRDYYPGFLTLWTVLILGASITACMVNYGVPQPVRSPKGASMDTKVKVWRVIAVLGLLSMAGLYFLWVRFLIRHGLSPANEVSAYWRSVHLLSGVSPLLPQVILLAGWYGWFWFTLQGLGMVGDDIPKLPPKDELPEPRWPLSDEAAGKEIAKAARPLAARFGKSVLVFLGFISLVLGLALRDYSLRSLGEKKFGTQIFFCVALSLALILADSFQLLRIWSLFRKLLVRLDGLPLRRTLAAIKEHAWGSLWNLSATSLEERYKVVSRQFESLCHLKSALALWKPGKNKESGARDRVLRSIEACIEEREQLVVWARGLRTRKRQQPGYLEWLIYFKERLSALNGQVLCELLDPAWELEAGSLICDWNPGKGKSPDEDASAGPITPAKLPEYVLPAEESFVLPYIGFIQSILGRMRTISFGVLCVFVTTTLAISSYPFDPLPVLAGLFLGVFVIVGWIFVYVYGGLNKDATLSHITRTNPGELGGQFWMQAIAFGIGPLIGLLTTLFPSLTDFVVSWLQPSAQAVK